MNLYSAFSIAIFKCALQVSYLLVICGLDQTSSYTGTTGSCYQSISDITQHMNEMRPYRNTENSMSTYGIPWHISVAFRKRAEQIELLTFCHIFKSCTQVSRRVLAVMANVIQQLNSTMLRMDTVFYRQMLGVTAAGPALLAQALSPANKVLRSGVLISPMHKGIRERVTAKRRPSRFTCGLLK